MEKFEQFWMVIRMNPSKSREPMYRHTNQATAEAECERLALKHNDSFGVLKLIKVAQIERSPVVWAKELILNENRKPVEYQCNACACKDYDDQQEPCISCVNNSQFRPVNKVTAPKTAVDTCVACEFYACDEHKRPCSVCKNGSGFKPAQDSAAVPTFHRCEDCRYRSNTNRDRPCASCTCLTSYVCSDTNRIRGCQFEHMPVAKPILKHPAKLHICSECRYVERGSSDKKCAYCGCRDKHWCSDDTKHHACNFEPLVSPGEDGDD